MTPSSKSVPFVLTLLLGASVSSVAAADPADGGGESSGPIYERGGLSGIGLVTGLKLGGGFGQPFNELQTSFVAELELGYNLPVLDRSLGLFLSGQYNAPSAEAKGLDDELGPDGDSRLPAEYGYELTQRQAIVTLGAIYRIPLSMTLFRPYVALGGRYYMMRTEIGGSVTPEGDPAIPFGENEETSSTWGFYGALGGEFYVGPGAALLEIQTGQASTDQFILRDSNVSTLNVALGYRLFL